MINNLTATEQVALIGQVFAKIATNFWPVIVLAIVACLVLAHQESRSK